MHIQRACCDEFVMAAVVMIMQDSWESLPLPPHPSLSGLEPVIMVLFTCNTLSNLFTFNPFRNLCICAAGLVASGYVIYLSLS